ncbi:MAG: DUF177 domain-containing protein [Elusimicrobiales bacterium]
MNDYRVPADLKFRAADIIEQGGLRCSLRLEGDALAALSDCGKILGAVVEVEFFLGSDELFAAGSVKGRAALRCHRCLEDYEAGFSAQFEQTFSPEAEIIDIMDEARQALVVSTEIRQLCARDCKGLCPVCGANLNKGSCGCAPARILPFSELRDKLSGGK